MMMESNHCNIIVQHTTWAQGDICDTAQHLLSHEPWNMSKKYFNTSEIEIYNKLYFISDAHMSCMLCVIFFASMMIDELEYIIILYIILLCAYRQFNLDFWRYLIHQTSDGMPSEVWIKLSIIHNFNMYLNLKGDSE
jgi:hypothetical protein